MESGTLLQDHLDTFNKLVMDLQTAGIEKDEETIHFEEGKGDEASGLFVRGRTSQQGMRKSKYRSKSHVNKKNAECWGCHNKGHLERDCPMSKSKEKASASIVEQVHDFDEDYVLTTSCNSGVYDNKWSLDFGCTLHMTFRRDWFSSYETSGGTVLTGNIATCKIVALVL
ncbi:hypothetical protein KY290_010780 [Solanum tuberosum]|uniref:CCHC-type domain-containing protein n=1 Tax=Solanum tuberosum TaxID=4113 RepID=A0ABQ7VYR3_SOLTU|nr:hypothetical protein KY290_010780 [Solanum tuberosum]